MTCLISASALKARMAAEPDLLILDATFLLPALGRDGEAEFAQARIPGALRFDIDAFARPSGDLPHMLPTPEAAAAMLGALGLTPDRPVVAYDRWMMMGAARAWWSLRVFGHEQVAVLDGGWAAWRGVDGAEQSGPAAAPLAAAPYPVRYQQDLVVDEAAVSSALAGGDRAVVDLRPAERFTGAAPEPRAGLRAGHMPGARNLPFSTLLEADGRMKDDAALKTLLADLPAAPIASCGSGVSACLLALAAGCLGDHGVAVYDGSWSEWGRADGPPVATDAKP